MQKIKLIIPIYSMRSYEDGRYSILKDGNFKLHINRMDLDRDFLVVPTNTSDYQEFLNLGLVPEERIFKCTYGLNTVETREKFWQWNQRKLALTFTDKFEIVTDITGYPGRLTFSNNFNITKLPNMNRPYIDDFYDSDILSIKKGKHTTVLNQCQKDYILRTNPEIPEDKIEVNQRVISDKYFKAVGTAELPKFEFEKGDIFFPFRLTDPAYEFQAVLEEAEFRDVLFKKKTRVVVTDPNDSLEDMCIDWPDRIVKIRPNKQQYYGLLSQKPTIIYRENPERVFHPGLADFLYFGCDIICPFKLPRLGEVII